MGKDTVASIISELIGSQETTIHRMSKTLKEAVCVLYGYHPDVVEGPSKEEVDPRYGITPRCAIQGICDYLMQRHGCQFFSKQVFAAYDQGAFGTHHVIIPDIRYEHDLVEIRKRGGVIIKIVRPYGSDVPCHPWEAHIDELKGDYCIKNTGQIDDLRKRVREIFNQISENSGRESPYLVSQSMCQLTKNEATTPSADSGLSSASDS